MRSGSQPSNDKTSIDANKKTTVDEAQLLTHLRTAMRQNIEAQSYNDAIFFADKIVHLVS